MPDYAYVARDAAGAKVTGNLAAANEREAIAMLSKQALFPINVQNRAPEEVSTSSRRVKPRLMASTYTQLADLLRSGVPMMRSLHVLREQTSDAGLKAVLGSIHDEVEQGTTLAEAMSRFPNAFGEMAVSMIRAGGEGAFLEDALERVAEFTEKQQDLKSRTIGALVYPIFLASVGVIIVSVIMIFFVPKFAELFGKMRERGELPFLTEALLAISALMQRWWWLVFGLLGAAYFAVRSRLQTEEGRLFRDRLMLRLPIVGGIFQGLAVSRFCRVLGTLLHNGVPILRALEISGGATANRVLSAAVESAAVNISSGETLAKPLAASGYFPRNVVEMIAVAEESNTLEHVLNNVANSLDKETSRKLDLAVRLLEPLMLAILALAVLLVAMGLLMPLFNMSRGL